MVSRGPRSRRYLLVRCDFIEALEKVLLGARRGVVMSPADRERTAYHEAGHALVGMLTPHADPVRKVSIIPRGAALGVTLATPDADRLNYLKDELDAKIRVALGGRVAEEVVCGSISTGAQSDIQQLTSLARHCGKLGYERGGRPYNGARRRRHSTVAQSGAAASEQTHRLPEDEVRRRLTQRTTP